MCEILNLMNVRNIFYKSVTHRWRLKEFSIQILSPEKQTWLEGWVEVVPYRDARITSKTGFHLPCPVGHSLQIVHLKQLALVLIFSQIKFIAIKVHLHVLLILSFRPINNSLIIKRPKNYYYLRKLTRTRLLTFKLPEMMKMTRDEGRIQFKSK